MEKKWSINFRYIVFVFVVISLVAFIGATREMWGPMVIAALLTYLLYPIVIFFANKTRLSHRASAGIVFLFGLAILTALPIIFLPILIDQIQLVASDIEPTIAKLNEVIAEPIVLLNMQIDLQQILPDFTQLFTDGISEFTSNALHFIESTTRNLLWVLVILVVIYYLLRDWNQLRERLFGLIPREYEPDARKLFEEIKGIWRGYLRGNLSLMLVVSILFGISWFILGVPGALFLGVVAGVLTIIPDVGPMIAALLAVAVAWVEGSTVWDISPTWFALVVFIVYLVLINIKNIWIRPRIFGRSVHMHDGVIFVAIIAAVVLTGILGAIVVVPALASVGVIYRYVWRRVLGENPFPEVEPEPEAVEDAVPEGELEPAAD
jgi:predicted PurR-regulated permease PerM